MYKLVLVVISLIVPWGSCVAETSRHCVDQGYVCLNQGEFVDSVAVYSPEEKELKLYLFTEKRSSEDKRHFGKRFKSVDGVSGRIEIDFVDTSSRNVEKLDVDVRVDKQWREKNGVKGIYVSARQGPADPNFSVIVEGDLTPGGQVRVITSGRKQSSDIPIDVDWKIDVQSEVIVVE